MNGDAGSCPHHRDSGGVSGEPRTFLMEQVQHARIQFQKHRLVLTDSKLAAILSGRGKPVRREKSIERFECSPTNEYQRPIEIKRQSMQELR
jgi:hypothetical protein